MSEEFFSVPYGWSPETGVLVARVVLGGPLQPGNLRQIARVIERLAPLAETVIEPPAPADADPLAPPHGADAEGGEP